MLEGAPQVLVECCPLELFIAVAAITLGRLVACVLLRLCYVHSHVTRLILSLHR